VDVDCFLCVSGVGIADLPWHDRPLWLDPRAGLAVPGLGGLAPGYVLAAPLGHHPSLRSAVLAHGSPLLGFLSEVMSYLEERMGPLTFWEHGSAPERAGPRSACIDHAHLNIVAGAWRLPEPPMARRFASLSDALTADEPDSADDGYLLLGWSGRGTIVGRDTGVSQYYRREWARLIGRRDHWDYVIAEDSSVTIRTIELVLRQA
jgi:hypothetical protein